MKNTKPHVTLLLFLLISLAGYTNAQNRQTPLFTEFRTDEDIKNEAWTYKITDEVELGNYILQLVTSKESADYMDEWILVQVLEKSTLQLVQNIELDGYGLADIFCIDDYNFDGFDDFSLLRDCGALGNSYSIYFLFDSNTNTFIDAETSGTNLDFDSESKTVTSCSRCCAGAAVTYQTYKWAGNRLILIEQQCLEAMRDKDTGDVLCNEEGEFIFEEVDCQAHYVDVELQSVGLKNNFRLRVAVYDEDMAGGFALYDGQTERIPIHFDREEIVEKGNGKDCPVIRNLFYNEMCQDEKKGVYVLTVQDTVFYSARYIREKDGTVFDLEIISGSQ